jgi:outer membrane protein, multidrug efflux system
MSHRDLFPISALLLGTLLVPGCAVGPNYRRPRVNVPPAFRGAEGAAQQASFADVPWWQIFKDDTLTGLVKTALKNNYDLAIAAARVEQSRQIAAQARSQYFPQIDSKTRLSAGSNQFNVSPSGTAGGFSGLFLGIATVAWEADLWGRIRRLNEAAKAEYLGTSEARRGVMLSLVSDVSTAYFQLLGLRRKLEIAVLSENAFDQSRTLFLQRLEGGISSMLPVSRASANQTTAAAQVTEFQRLIALTENQISILLGQNPGPIQVKTTLLVDTVPPAVPAGLPSALLQRRPDILSAEQHIRSKNAQIGVAKADYFPKIGLTGFYGKLSLPLSAFTSGNSNAGSIGMLMEGPLFQGGRLKARKREAVAEWDQAKSEYLQTVLNAFRDVSDALISRGKYEGVRADQAKTVQSLEEAVRLAQMRYDQGFSSYYEVLEAQQQLFPAQLALTETDLDQRLVIIQLYRALGGGWNLTDTQFITAGAP